MSREPTIFHNFISANFVTSNIVCVFISKMQIWLYLICGMISKIHNHVARTNIEMWLVEKLYLSKGLKDGFQHVLTYIVVERPNVEFPRAFSFLQVLCLGCKPEKWWAKIRIANQKATSLHS